MATLTTPVFALPYPDGTERVADGDNAIGALALAVENAFGPTRAALRYERRTNGQGFTDALEAVCTFPDVARDDGRGILTSANGVVTVVRAGWVTVEAGLLWPTNAAGFRQLFIYAGGVNRNSTRHPAPANGGLPMAISDSFYVPAGTVVELHAVQNSGGGSTTVPDVRNHISVVYHGS